MTSMIRAASMAAGVLLAWQAASAAVAAPAESTAQAPGFAEHEAQCAGKEGWSDPAPPVGIFAAVEHSDQTEPAIVAALGEQGALALSLVAEDAGDLISHAAFSPVTIEARDIGWFGLGSVSVAPPRQRRGVGSALIGTGLDQLWSAGAGGCVVLGDPVYYLRFGFGPDTDLRYEGAPAVYLMRLVFGSTGPSGRVDYHPAFGASLG